MSVERKITAMFCSFCLFFTLASCGKQESDSSLKPEGHLVAGVAGDGEKMDDSLTTDEFESLDKTGVNPLAGDTSSPEYRQKYGRSSEPLLPVYFDFDSSSINVDQLENLNDSGAHLQETSYDLLVIEGNCDKRGTADYNLALGELRAINVKKYMVNIGVDGDRIKTISYGSERPLFHGSDEESWAANRRADLVLP